jgi:hypothetical protein
MYGNGTSFNGVLSPDTYDHGAAELQRQHQVRIARYNREQRAERWLVGLMGGKTFHSIESLIATATQHVVALRGDITLEETDILTRAARIVWAGLNAPAGIQRTFTPTGLVESITFPRAA